MRVIGVRQYGGPEVLEVLDLPDPHAGPGQVRIRVHAATVNPTDTLLRSGALDAYHGRFGRPHVPGMDAAGVVDEVGVGAVRDGGRIVTVCMYVGPEERGTSWHRVAVPELAEDHLRLDELRAPAESGDVTLRVADIYPAEYAAEAHSRLEKGGTRGRLVLTF